MDAITQNRREFHKFAETSWNEIRTSARIAEILETAGVQTILMGRDAVNVETLHSPIELSMQQRQQNMRRALQQGAKMLLLKKQMVIQRGCNYRYRKIRSNHCPSF